MSRPCTLNKLTKRIHQGVILYHPAGPFIEYTFIPIAGYSDAGLTGCLQCLCKCIVPVFVAVEVFYLERIIAIRKDDQGRGNGVIFISVNASGIAVKKQVGITIVIEISLFVVLVQF